MKLSILIIVTLLVSISTTSSLPLKFSKNNAAVQLNFLQVNSGKLDARRARKGGKGVKAGEDRLQFSQWTRDKAVCHPNGYPQIQEDDNYKRNKNEPMDNGGKFTSNKT